MAAAISPFRQSLPANCGDIGEFTATRNLLKFLAEQFAHGRRYGRRELDKVYPALGMSRKAMRVALAQLVVDGSLKELPWAEAGGSKTYLHPVEGGGETGEQHLIGDADDDGSPSSPGIEQPDTGEVAS